MGPMKVINSAMGVLQESGGRSPCGGCLRAMAWISWARWRSEAARGIKGQCTWRVLESVLWVLTYDVMQCDSDISAPRGPNVD